MKKCIIYGDSISTTNFSAGGYQKTLGDMLCAEEMINFAENSAALSSGYPYSVYDKTTDIEPVEDVDLVIVWAGTNDWYYGVPLGSADSRLTTDFCGCLRGTVLNLCRAYPKSTVIYVSPIYRYSDYEGNADRVEAFETKNAVGCTLYDYYKAMQQVSEKTGFPLCDMRTLSGINAANHTFYLRDGIHPSVAGYKKIADILYNFAEKYILK